MLTLLMDAPPQKGNERGHWKARWGRRKAYFNAQDSRQLAGLIPPPPAKPMDRVRIRAHLYLWNQMDPDNLTSRLKDAIDWCVSRGYLLSDSPVVIRELVVEQEIDRQKDGRLVLEIEEV